MSKRIKGEQHSLTCLVAMVFVLTGVVCGASLVFAQTERAPVAAPKAVPAKSPTPATGKAITPSTAKLAPGEKVNINTATKEKLGALPGIGPAKAQAIIDGRPYAKPEDIMKVKGIKKGIYDKLKDLITVQ